MIRHTTPSREAIVLALAGLGDSEALLAIATIATVRASEPGLSRARWNAIANAAVAVPTILGRHSVRVTVANLDEAGRELLATVIAILTDPILEPSRERLMSGEMALGFEAGEVTWMDTPAMADALADRFTSVSGG